MKKIIRRARNELAERAGGVYAVWWVLLLYLEKLFDYDGRFDGRDAACRDEKNVCVPFALVGSCGKLSCHGNGKEYVNKCCNRTSARTICCCRTGHDPSSIIYIHPRHLVCGLSK